MKIGMSSTLAENSMFAVATNPYVAGGFAAYGTGAVLWLKVLSRVELSLAYPHCCQVVWTGNRQQSA
jgi:hypothetical protein